MSGMRNGPEMPDHVLGSGHTPVSPLCCLLGSPSSPSICTPHQGSIQAHGESLLDAQTCP